jgi:Tfp pilus assembly protein PilF
LALALLYGVPNIEASDDDVNFLAGQHYFRIGDAKTASSLFEKAVAAHPANSRYLHWLGRAYGRRAEMANIFLAPRFAIQARQNFEEAIRVDPHNTEAMNDLFEYYLDAPAILGGGLEKAAALAKRVLALDPAEYHYDLARLAEKRRELSAAEWHYRRALELDIGAAGRIIDLAQFLEARGRQSESDRFFNEARLAEPLAANVWFREAKTYIHSRRNLELARSLLTRYLASTLAPDDPPRSEAEKLLRQLSAK